MADDMVCLADSEDMVCLDDSEEGLQKMLKTLEIFCCENGLQTNRDKTKCMSFNKSGRLMRRNFHIKADGAFSRMRIGFKVFHLFFIFYNNEEIILAQIDMIVI